MNLGQSGSCARCGTRTRRRGPILPSHQPGPSPRRGCMCHNIEPLNGVAVLVVVRLHLRTPRKGMSECAIKVDLGAWTRDAHRRSLLGVCSDEQDCACRATSASSQPRG